MAPETQQRDDTRPARPAWATYLRTLRTARSLTTTAAAALMNISQPTWVGIESGRRTVGGVTRATRLNDITISRIAHALDLTSEERHQLDLLNGETDTRPPSTRRPWQQTLRQIRLTHSLTPRQAAAAAGVATETYRQWERRDDGSPSRDNIEALLAHLSLTGTDIATELLAGLPVRPSAVRTASTSADHAPPPTWAQTLAAARLAAGKHMSDLDSIVGSSGVYRRLELGGWPRRDGTFAVPSDPVLVALAAAVAMTPDQTRDLLDQADQQRLSNATHGRRPFCQAALREARNATGSTPADLDGRLSLPRPWQTLEASPAAAEHALRDPAVLEHIITGLPIGEVLADGIRATVNEPQPPVSAAT